MSNIERNREFVQDGLDRRAARRAEDAQDADTLAFLAELNRKTAARLNEDYVAQTAQRREAARKATQTRRYANQYTYLQRTFYSLVLPIAMAVLLTFGVVPLVPTVIVWIAAGLFIIVNFAAYATRNRREREALAKAWKWIMAVKNEIFAAPNKTQ